MGRPRGSKNKSTIQKEIALGVAGVQLIDTRTDEEIVTDIARRFDIFRDLMHGVDGNPVISIVVSGSAGVGKSFTADAILSSLTLKKGIRYTIVKGKISAFDLYELAYQYKDSNCVIVLDDADAIFEDEDGLNILKSLLDTSIERKVCWMTDHPRFRGDNALPKQFLFYGSMIFLTNRNFQSFIDAGVGRYADHMLALMSRSIYLDLKMHTRREVSLWIRHLVSTHRILQSLGGISPSDETMLTDWIVKHRDQLRELSIRTALKLGTIFKIYKSNWEVNARTLFVK